MIIESGHFVLILSLLMAFLQSTVPMIGVHLRNNQLMAIAAPAAIIQFVLIFGSFLALTYAYVVSDFATVAIHKFSFSTYC